MKKKDRDALIASIHKIAEAAQEIESILIGEPADAADTEPKTAPAAVQAEQPAEEPKHAAEPAPEKRPEKAVTAADVRKVLARKAKKHREEVRQLIIKHNADCLSDIKDPAVLAEILKEAEAIPDA